MQPINLSSGEDPIADLDRCGALAIGGQIVQRDYGLSERRTINRLVAVYQRRWLACVGIDFIFFAAHVLPPIWFGPSARFDRYSWVDKFQRTIPKCIAQAGADDRNRSRMLP